MQNTVKHYSENFSIHVFEKMEVAHSFKIVDIFNVFGIILQAL